MSTARAPKKQPPVQEELWEGKRDPEMYVRLSRPFPTQQAAEVATNRFLEALYALRVEHGIADVTVLTAVPHQANGQVLSIIGSSHYGDASLQLPMVSELFRALQEREQARIARMGSPQEGPRVADPDELALSAETAARVRRMLAALNTNRGAYSEVITGKALLSTLVKEGLAKTSSLTTLLEGGPAHQSMTAAEELAFLRGAAGQFLSDSAERLTRMLRRLEELQAVEDARKDAPEDAPASTGEAAPGHPPADPDIEPSVGDEPAAVPPGGARTT